MPTVEVNDEPLMLKVEHEDVHDLKGHKRKASSGLQKDSTSESASTPEKSKKTKVEFKEKRDSAGDKEDDNNSPNVDIATNDKESADVFVAEENLPLGDGPHEFLLWGDALLYLLEGDPDSEPPTFRLAGEVVTEHTRWHAAGGTDADWDDVYSRNIRSWKVSITSPDCAETEGARLLRDVKARVSAAAIPHSTGNEKRDKDLVETWPWWFVLTVQRQEPVALVPKLGGLMFWDGGASKDAQGEWWITDVKVAETAAYVAISEMIDYLTWAEY